MNTEVGDKVRLKSGGFAGCRGAIQAILDNDLVVLLDGKDRTICVGARATTNLSLAARKAWIKMPQRKVGRPKGAKVSDRISVTIRVNRDQWERFRALEMNGRIHDRTDFINQWLQEKLNDLEAERV